ncbi:MAG: serine/threonine protein kinase, partial [Planctomycetes bacterium]|nr:serine/threonine protein kinase [Planctomycetota bacterium]
MKICLSCEGVTNAQASRCGHCNGWLLSTDCVHYPLRRGEIDAGNPLLGTVVDGKYRLQSVLGRGGLGTVFRAQHIGSLVTVALKLLHPRFAERPEYRRALLPEARRAATVTHERCARLLDAGEADAGVAYLVMELVEGKTLDLVLRQGPLHPSHAVAVLEQIAEALAAIHAVGLVHCDLSPRNVMVAPRAAALQVKVLDFGIARSVSLAGAQQGKGAFAGFLSPAFAAPELLRGDDVDPRADLWSFGVLAWLLLTGTMPHEDADPARAAAAILAGERRPWPARVGVPRRLVRIVRHCLQPDRAQRPVSAAMVARQLSELREARRPQAARLAVSAAVVAALGLLSSPTTVVAPLLQPVSGSPLALVQSALRADHEVQHRQSRQLETLVFHCAGFEPSALRADLVRGGRGLLRTTLRPEVDPTAGTLTVSTAQVAWQEVVQGLLRCSEQDAIDLVFVVPGSAPLGAARLRLDDTPPVVQASLHPDGAGLSGDTVLRCTFADAVGVHLATATIVPEVGTPFEIVLPKGGGEVAFGQEIAAKLGSCAAFGGGQVCVHALDQAGNRAELVLPYLRADVAAPVPRTVTGPALEPFLPAVGGRVRMRLELSAGEPDCTLAIGVDGAFGPELPLPGAHAVHSLECDLGDAAVSGPWVFRVTDAVGNTSQREFAVQVRDRSSRVEVVGNPAGTVFVGDELVVVSGPRTLSVRISSNWTPVSVRVVPQPGPAAAQLGQPVAWRLGDAAPIALDLPNLPYGRYALWFDLQEGDVERGLHTTATLPLRVLPDAIELSLPATNPRFLPQLVAAGVLQASGQGYVEGPGVRIDPELRPFVRGTLRVGSGPPLVLPVDRGRESGAALLPVLLPTPGRNLVVLDLVDPFDRPLRVRRGFDDTGQPATGFVFVDFVAASGAPELVGEEVLVEHGQPARVRLRCPVPFAAVDLPNLRLQLA